MVMDKQSCPHNGTVFISDKKAVGCSVVWITLTLQCWTKEPDTKDWTPSNSATRRQTKQTHCKHTGQISDYLWLELREELHINGLGIQFFEDENVKTGLWREHAEVCTVIIRHWIIHLQQAVFIICNLYLNESITKQNKTYHFLKKKSCCIC